MLYELYVSNKTYFMNTVNLFINNESYLRSKRQFLIASISLVSINNYFQQIIGKKIKLGSGQTFVMMNPSQIY